MAGAPTHRMTGTPLFRVWQGMRTRCSNPNRKSFKNYGGRGIVVCDRWESFEAFYADMSVTYKRGLTIERIDNDGPYSPENCEWVPKARQSKNRRPARIWQFRKSGIKTNTSGERGVCWDRSRNKWIASICVAGKQKNLGRFDSKSAAKNAYLSAASALRG